MCGGNLGSGNGNVPVVTRALPALKNSENQNQPSSKIVTTSGKDPQLPITVG